MLWSIFITYIITHHGLGGFSGLINGLIAAAIGALSMLMSEPTVKKLCKEDMYACPLNRDIYIYIYNVMGSLKSVNKLTNTLFSLQLKNGWLEVLKLVALFLFKTGTCDAKKS